MSLRGTYCWTISANSMRLVCFVSLVVLRDAAAMAANPEMIMLRCSSTRSCFGGDAWFVSFSPDSRVLPSPLRDGRVVWRRRAKG